MYFENIFIFRSFHLNLFEFSALFITFGKIFNSLTIGNTRVSYFDSSSFVLVGLFGFANLSKYEAKMSERPEDHRRKWDRDEFERLAADRLREELELEDKKNKKGIFYSRSICNCKIISLLHCYRDS